jgi:sugar lactone lactonase YvrE
LIPRVTCTRLAAEIAAGGRANQDAPPPGIHVFSPEGRRLRTYRVYEDYITDCAFGGPDRKALYITPGKSLFSVPMEISGTGR